MFPHSFNISGGAGLEEMLHPHEHQMEQQRWRWKPSVEVAPNCPRCASTNTKFCYYNNYSLSQPRYFCKACRRYWTKGGSLRNVPVGGGCRKNRRSKSSSSSRHHPFGCVSQDSSISMAGDDSQNDTNNASPDIDMALVFAKFLNPKPSTAEDNNNNNVSSSTTSNNYLETENDESENKGSGSSDPVVVVESENFGEIDELERLLGVCDDEDGLWSSSWEPLPFSMPPPLNDSDDAEFLPISSASTFTDSCWTNCTSFDLSTMELFSSAPS